MRKAAVLLVSTAAVLMVVGVLVTQSLLVLQRVAAVEDVRGMVWVRSHGEGEFVPLADRARVGTGDVLKTGDKGRVDLRWVDDTRMRIGPNAQVTVLKSHYNSATKGDTQIFKLDLGRVWIRILKVLSQKSKFEIVTPSATAGVRGTIFSVAVGQDGKTLVSVKEGKVAVSSGEARQEIEPGQMLQDGAAGAMPEAEQETWDENETVALPHLEVKEPAPGADGKVAYRPVITVSGTTEQGAVVTVNGKQQELRLGKLFSTELVIPPVLQTDFYVAPTIGLDGKPHGGIVRPQPFQIVVEATDRRGYKARQVIDVQRD